MALVNLTRQICGEKCPPAGMAPVMLVDGDVRRKRVGRHEISHQCCTKGCTRRQIKAMFCCKEE
ncbi:hypothetical protein AAVH_40945 [Aphelenchoides avenae]|nr:hypothetical protein AAVH_40945 [Aphelenchus avenae]